jgi:hypothetical protein
VELQALLKALNASHPSRWRDAALFVLNTEELSFAGRSEPRAEATAHELAQIYRFRLEHIRKRGIAAVGIEEVLEALSQLSPDARVHGTPFLGRNRSVYAFLDENGILVGCVTVIGPVEGYEDLKRALGQPI